MIFGYLLGIAIISAISALYIKLGVRLVGNRNITFAKAFVVSAVSFLAAFFAQDLLTRTGSESSLFAAMPAFVFFFVCWLLNTQFIRYGEENSKNYGKAFLVTVIQCFALFLTGMIFSFVLIAVLSSL